MLCLEGVRGRVNECWCLFVVVVVLGGIWCFVVVWMVDNIMGVICFVWEV